MDSKKKPDDHKPSTDEKLDRALEDTFPASDPVAITEDTGPKKDEKR